MKRLLLNPLTWILCLLSPASWATDAIYTPWYNNLAIKGIDPSQFSIVDGKLYLNFSRRIQNRWLEDRDGYIAAADQRWPEIRDR